MGFNFSSSKSSCIDRNEHLVKGERLVKSQVITRYPEYNGKTCNAVLKAKEKNLEQ